MEITQISKIGAGNFCIPISAILDETNQKTNTSDINRFYTSNIYRRLKSVFSVINNSQSDTYTNNELIKCGKMNQQKNRAYTFLTIVITLAYLLVFNVANAKTPNHTNPLKSSVELSSTDNDPVKCKEFKVRGVATDATCNQLADGRVQLLVSGGLPPYSYVWSNGQKTNQALSLGVGSYKVTVKDKNNCEFSASYVIDANVLVEANFDVNDNVLYLEGGSAKLVILNKSVAETNTWNFGDGSDNIVAQSPTHNFTKPGIYTVTLTAGKGNCTDVMTKSIVVKESSSIANSNSKLKGVKVNKEDKAVSLSIDVEETSDYIIDVKDKKGKSVYHKTYYVNRIQLWVDLDTQNSDEFVVDITEAKSGKKYSKQVVY